MDVDMAIVLNGGGTISHTVAGILNIIGGGTNQIISGTGPLTKTGAGIIAIATASTYTGATIINDGVLRIRTSNNRLPTGTAVTVTGPGSLDLANLNQQVGSLAGNGSVTLGSGTLTVGGSGSGAFSGIISGTGRVTKQGSGTLTLTGNNTFSGGSRMTAGRIRLGHNSALGSGVFTNGGGRISSDSVTARAIANAMIVTNNATFGHSTDNGHVTYSGAVTLTGGNHTLTVDSQTTFSGNVGEDTPGRSLTKAGVGTLTLSGNNTYTGGTTNTAGTLHLQGSSPIGTGPLTINGGKVTGSGLSGVAVTINSGGAISPGNSPGTMTTGSETWEGGGKYIWEINDVAGSVGADPGWDQLVINGNLTINATAGNKFIIDVTSLTGGSAGPASGFDNESTYSWDIATISGSVLGNGFDPSFFDLQTGNFTGDGGPLGTFSLGLNAGNVTLGYAAIPEPSTIALGVLGAVALGVARIRRRK